MGPMFKDTPLLLQQIYVACLEVCDAIPEGVNLCTRNNRERIDLHIAKMLDSLLRCIQTTTEAISTNKTLARQSEPTCFTLGNGFNHCNTLNILLGDK